MRALLDELLPVPVELPLLASQAASRRNRRIRLPEAAVRPTGVLVKPGLAVLLEAVDPLTLVPGWVWAVLRDMLKRSEISVME